MKPSERHKLRKLLKENFDNGIDRKRLFEDLENFIDQNFDSYCEVQTRLKLLDELSKGQRKYASVSEWERRVASRAETRVMAKLSAKGILK